jgi:predicted dehydrogenase
MIIEPFMLSTPEGDLMSASSSTPVRVGIVGLSANGFWAATSHVPALAAVDGFELCGVAASSPAASRASAEAYGVPLAFDDVEHMAASDEIDLIVVSVKVPEHRRLVLPVLAAGKMIFCEWPLAANLVEAEELAQAAQGLRTFIGLQNRSAVAVRFLKDLVADGYVGKVLSTTLVANGGIGGATAGNRSSYLLPRENGASMLTIPFGHTVDAVTSVLGEIAEVKATTAVLRPTVLNTDTGEMLPKTAEDQIAAVGTFESGAVFSVHYRGGTPKASPFLWEINGTDGDLQVTAAGNTPAQGAVVRGARNGEELHVLEVPSQYDRYPELVGQPAHAVAHAYGQMIEDIRTGSQVVPDFTHARDRHRLLDRIQHSGGTPL